MRNVVKVYIVSMLLSLLTVSVPQSVSANIDSLSSAINKAGRQRMLSQRMVATYSQLGMDIQSKKSKAQLKEAIILFEQQLAELKIYKSKGEIHKQLNLVTELWQPMKKIVSAPVNRSSVTELRKQAEEVLKASHRVVLLLEKQSKTKSGRLVNISGRQRMLSQRISNLYMLQSWGFNESEYSVAHSRSVNEFRQALQELMSAPVNTAVINKKLNKARKQFSVLEKSTRQKDGEFIPLMVKMSADKLLVIMNDITQDYDNLARAEMISSR